MTDLQIRANCDALKAAKVHNSDSNKSAVYKTLAVDKVVWKWKDNSNYLLT